MKTTVQQMLSAKADVYAVKPEDTVYDALRLMAAKNVGAVLVIAGEDLRGILSERDYARRVVLHGRMSQATTVSEIMTTNVICIDRRWTADRCMALMTEKHIRHLPVVEEGRVVGVVSIGDIVRAVVDAQNFTIQSLEQYITSGG